MTYWNGTILGPPHSTHENRIYSLSLEVGPEYPAKPPVVKFLTKVNIPCVDQNTGVVKKKPKRLFCFAEGWFAQNPSEASPGGLGACPQKTKWSNFVEKKAKSVLFGLHSVIAILEVDEWLVVL
ncbi:hypothetical protein TRICI_000032 [Trichomonascus ciferrii]|uniref:UBC core domain-containing protein n=1 Tax=Trichomonascus ciferrii TaxID=44093 RepID=A0A642VEM1_9ASCO|nr:hypothetical protein TRICI_000032 [Trichomonascus ciferrii]